MKDANHVTPIRSPNKFLALGANYAGHLKEMGVPPKTWVMQFFSCRPTTSIAGPGKTVPMPPGTQSVDWECELTAIIGKSIKDATVDEAKDAIAGFTIGLDLSCRDLFRGSFGLTYIIRGKSQPGMKPCLYYGQSDVLVTWAMYLSGDDWMED
jgi:2-keto-4-pentenoate hydratase/2-oxohepta-3-ene-1,7-dioic acid hydratase in catechol pathway